MIIVVTLVQRVALLVKSNPLVRDQCGLSIPEVAIVNPLQGNPIFVNVMDLLRGSLRGILTRTIVLVSGGFPSLCILVRARDSRPRIRPPGIITGIVSSQFSNLIFQPLRFKVLCIPAMDIYVGSNLSKMLSFCFDVGFVTLRLCLEGFLLLALA
jgi:hypothetical protein